MISAFCERIGLTSLELLVSHFHGRVLHGVKEDLVNLTNIKGVRGTTARLLYTAGLETVECIADASDQEIHAALCQGKRASEHQGEWKKARMILKSAIHLLQVCAAYHVRRFCYVLAWSWSQVVVLECDCGEAFTACIQTADMCVARNELMLPRSP